MLLLKTSTQKIEGGCKDSVFAIEIIDLKRFCHMNFFKNFICCRISRKLFIYEFVTKFTLENV